MTLGTKLKAARLAKGLRLREAQALSGVSASTISRAERDIGEIWAHHLAKLSRCYGVSVDALLPDDDIEMTDEETNAFLVAHGYDLDKLRDEINALIDELRDQAAALLRERTQQ